MDVLVMMGSANDYDVAKRVVPLFRRFGIDAHITVASAHRTPARVESLVRQAEADGATRCGDEAAGGPTRIHTHTHHTVHTHTYHPSTRLHIIRPHTLAGRR